MILFIGSKDKGYFMEDVAPKFGETITYIQPQGEITKQTNDILQYAGDTNFMVFDIEQYISSVSDIVNEISRIQKCNNAKPIIFASGYLPHSQIITELANSDMQIKNFIFSTNLSGMKEQAQFCLNGYYDKNGLEEIENIIQLKESEESEKLQYNFKLIGVAGACQRIGTTTHAVQIVKYLMLKGYKACYIHMNDTNYITNLLQWFVVEHDEELGKVVYQNVEHYYRVDKLPEIKKMGYDFLVYDYGAYFNTDFNKTSFLEKDFQIFIVGAEPTELSYTRDIITNVFYDDVKYIFNFASPKDKEDIDELMEEKASISFISPTITDKYVFENSEIYEAIIPIEDISEEAQKPKKKKKFGLFGKRG